MIDEIFEFVFHPEGLTKKVVEGVVGLTVHIPDDSKIYRFRCQSDLDRDRKAGNKIDYKGIRRPYDK